VLQISCGSLPERVERVREKEQKVQGNPFYHLPMADTHRGGRGLIRTEVSVVCFEESDQGRRSVSGQRH